MWLVLALLFLNCELGLMENFYNTDKNVKLAVITIIGFKRGVYLMDYLRNS